MVELLDGIAATDGAKLKPWSLTFTFGGARISMFTGRDATARIFFSKNKSSVPSRLSLGHGKMKTVDARTLERWRSWLAKHHDSETEVWLIFHKPHTGMPSVAYEDAVDEALCYGWIDSLIKRIDDDRYARKFTPRKPDSAGRRRIVKRYAALKAAKRLAPRESSERRKQSGAVMRRARAGPSYIIEERQKRSSRLGLLRHAGAFLPSTVCHLD